MLGMLRGDGVQKEIPAAEISHRGGGGVARGTRSQGQRNRPSLLGDKDP